MADDLSDLRRDVTVFLTSLRNSIDGPFRRNLSAAEAERERFLRTMMAVEEARIRFNSYTRYQAQPTATDWAAARNALFAFLETFQHSGDVERNIFERPFRIAPMLNRESGNSSAFIKRFPTELENRMTIAEALVTFRDHLANARIELGPVQTSLSFGDLEKIVPRQQVAPVQFDIVNNRIVVANRSPRKSDTDRKSIESALEHIKDSGDQLISTLGNSNCDKRLLESVKELQTQLTSDGNIVKIGLTNMACGIMSSQFQSELPDAVLAMFNSYNASISLYVAQFPEWDQFTQKAASIDLDEDDITEVDIAARELITTLSENPNLADPEVPKTIAFVQQFLTFPGSSAKRATFAMIRTIENLVSSILRHSVIFFSKTAEKTVESGSTVTSKVIVGLLGVALMGASGVGPAAVNAGAPWVKQAAEIVQKYINKSTD